MKKLIAVLLALVTLSTVSYASAQTDITIKCNGVQLAFNEKPILVNNKTLVQLRPIAEALDLGIEFALESGSVYLSNDDAVVVFQHNSDIVNINDTNVQMDVPMVIHNDYTFVPVRDLVEPFGYSVDYHGETKIIDIEKPTSQKAAEPEKEDAEAFEEVTRPVENEKPKVISTGSGEYDFVHYYQSQPDLELPENGRGYCWVCSYAMLFSNTLKSQITPLNIADFNIEKGYEGNFMAGHEELALEYGLELVPALCEDSQYFGGFNLKNRGETSLVITSDEDAKAAICEALDRFPQGVIVRYDSYPHSMVAVSYDGDEIYFNDPGRAVGEHITFDKTCLTNFKISDISSIQAVQVAE